MTLYYLILSIPQACTILRKLHAGFSWPLLVGPGLRLMWGLIGGVCPPNDYYNISRLVTLLLQVTTTVLHTGMHTGTGVYTIAYTRSTLLSGTRTWMPDWLYTEDIFLVFGQSKWMILTVKVLRQKESDVRRWSKILFSKRQLCQGHEVSSINQWLVYS